MGKRIAAIALLAVLGCATVTPGLNKSTTRGNIDRRAYWSCMQNSERAAFPSEVRRFCRLHSKLRWANWAWEDCKKGLEPLGCGPRPKFEDMR